MSGATRKYTKRARARGEERTRASIVSATVALWTEVGPAATSIAAIARHAGVQRLTVYRHFEDDGTLVVRAWAAFLESTPRPDPAEWASIGSPSKRLRRALRNLYAYYDRAGTVLANVLHDAPRVAALADAVRSHEGWLDGVVATLEAGWSARGGKGAAKLPAALLEHAVRLSTWRSLESSGLDHAAAARLIDRAMRGIARKGSGK